MGSPVIMFFKSQTCQPNIITGLLISSIEKLFFARLLKCVACYCRKGMNSFNFDVRT